MATKRIKLLALTPPPTDCADFQEWMNTLRNKTDKLVAALVSHRAGRGWLRTSK